MIAFNAKNHTKLSKNERDKFLQKLGFKDLVLLWNIYELNKKYNLINVLDRVNPIQYQKKIMDIIKIEKPNLSLLDKTPSFSYIIDNYLKNNKPTSKYEYLAVLSSKCAYDNDFRDNLIKNEIDTSKENYFSIGKSTIFTMSIALVGISIMFVHGLGSGRFYGNFMAFLCAIGFSSYAIIIRRNRRLEMLPTLILSNLIIMLVALIFTWDDLLISWGDLLLCFVLGGVLSATVNTFFIIAAKHLFAAELTLFMLLEFTLGPIWVWIFVNEVPTSWTLVGGSIVISAVFLKSVSELRKANI